MTCKVFVHWGKEPKKLLTCQESLFLPVHWTSLFSFPEYLNIKRIRTQKINRTPVAHIAEWSWAPLPDHKVWIINPPPPLLFMSIWNFYWTFLLIFVYYCLWQVSVAWKQEPWCLLIGVLSVLTSLTRYQDLQIISFTIIFACFEKGVKYTASLIILKWMNLMVWLSQR